MKWAKMNKILLLKISISLAVVCAIGATYYAISTGQEMRQRAAAQFNAEITAALKNSACQPLEFILNQEQVVMVCGASYQADTKEQDRQKYALELATWLAAKNFAKSKAKVIFSDEPKP